MSDVMLKKARQAQLCYADLMEKTGLYPTSKVVFRVDYDQPSLIKKACYQNNPFPGIVKAVLLKLRLAAVGKLFKDETVLQTGPAAASLALDAALAKDIGALRGGEESDSEVICDIGLAGLQVIRLYMMAYEGNKSFIQSRYKSATRVDNALNGSFYKYKTKDGRDFSAHVYYESQKAKIMKTLGIKKDPDKFVLASLPFDKKTTAKAVAKWNAEELEEQVFADGACGCMLRTREEWEKMPVGKAVCEMPLYRFTKHADAPKKDFGVPDSKKGPLSGIKVLDLTHIIAGPVCTRLLAENGADVLMIRRGDYIHQEQAMLELDGWAGKNSIQLDFNIPEQLEKAKELVKEADVVVCSYQNGALDKFGLGAEGIHALNPNIIYASMVCFSDTVWKERPGWAPCAEDITGLSIRNGSKENPVNLNGVPLDYIPGMILFSGIMRALKLQIEEGGSFTITGSLTRGGYWLHECTDLWESFKGADAQDNTAIKTKLSVPLFESVSQKAEGTAVGDVYFPSPATFYEGQGDVVKNMNFKDGREGFSK
jgi:hypothetical protein